MSVLENRKLEALLVQHAPDAWQLERAQEMVCTVFVMKTSRR